MTPHTRNKIGYYTGVIFGGCIIIMLGVLWRYILTYVIGQATFNAHAFPLTGVSALLGFLTYILVGIIIRCQFKGSE